MITSNLKLKSELLLGKKLQEEMDDLRGQIKELRTTAKGNGQSVDQDIEAYVDYLKVLKKKKTQLGKVTIQLSGCQKIHLPQV